MPSFSQPTASRLSPPAPVEAKGGPLSVRSASGRPYSRKARSKIGSTPSRVGATMSQHNRKRLCASLSVSGSQRLPSRVRNQPLKSAHQTSLGPRASEKGCVTGSARRRRRRSGTSPRRLSRSPMLLAAGHCSCGCKRSRCAFSLRGPQSTRRFRSFTISASISGSSPCAGRSGARERSCRPAGPSAR